MRIAITGSNGQLARSLGEIAKARGFAVTTLARPAFDLADPAIVARALDNIDADVVVNAAAYTAVDRAESDQVAAFAVNAHGARCVALACAQRSIPLIHVSTDYVFDGTKASPYLEGDATEPLSVYGRSKRDGELEVAAAHAMHVIVRTAWVHSPFGSNFVKTMLRLARERSEISVVNDQIGNPTYAPHLAGAIAAIAERISSDRNAPVWGTYHYVDSGEASWYDVAVATFEASQRLGGPSARVTPIPSAAYKTAARRPMNSRLDTSKLAKTFAIDPPNWRRGIELGVARILGSE